MQAKDERYPDYPLFKGLQRPLELMGLQGRYIYWAAGAAGGAIVGFIIAYGLVHRYRAHHAQTAERAAYQERAARRVRLCLLEETMTVERKPPRATCGPIEC